MDPSEPDIDETLEWLKEESSYNNQLTYCREVSSQSATTVEATLSAPIRAALEAKGINGLYQHQKQALNAAQQGEHVVLATATASGKSLPYRILACERALSSNSTTLYIAPTRALINDQAKAFEEFIESLETDTSVSVGVYTGETSKQERRRIRREQPDVLLMTPELVHMSLLPWGSRLWDWCLRSLGTIVLDEVHEFRGIFGSHAGLIFRRLNRLTEQHGGSPQYFCCSATIGNPAEHAGEVTGMSADQFEVIETDTSGRGARHWLLYNPPYKTTDGTKPPSNEYPDNWDSLRRKSFARDNYRCQKCGIRGGHVSPVQFQAHHIIPVGRGGSHDPANLITLCTACHADQPGHELTTESKNVHTAQEVIQMRERRSHRPIALQLFVELVAHGHQTLVFATARQEAEQYAVAATNKLKRLDQRDLAQRVTTYHAALSSTDRKAIENGLRSGEIRGAWSTNALELGVDIGGLDVVLLMGHPGTTMNLFQQAGRAGRGKDDALVLLVGSPNPLDQYYLSNPNQVFEEQPGNAVINPKNERIFPGHVLCAADESSISVDDERHLGSALRSVVPDLEASNELERCQTDEGLTWQSVPSDPQQSMNLRAIPERQFALVDDARGEKLGSLSLRDAIHDCHPNAVYTQLKQKYRVKQFEDEQDQILLTEFDGNEFTQALPTESITVHRTLKERTPPELRDVKVGLAEVTYRSQVDEYLVKEGPTDEEPERLSIEEPLPPFELETKAMYLTIPRHMRRRAGKMANVDHPELCGLHGIEHLLTSLFPLEVLCQRGDIGGYSDTNHTATGRGTIFIYDTMPGGVGLAKKGYELVEQLLERAYQTIIDCECQGGCPTCIHSARCRSGNMALHKDLTTLMLEWTGVANTRQYLESMSHVSHLTESDSG